MSGYGGGGFHVWDPLDPYASHADGRVVSRAEKEEASMAQSARGKRGVWVDDAEVPTVVDPKGWLAALAAPYGGLMTPEAQASPGYPRFRMYVQDAVWLDAVLESLAEERELPYGGKVRMWTCVSTERLIRFIERNDLAILDSAFRMGGTPAVMSLMLLETY